MEGTLRNAEQVAYYLLEEGWFTRELGSVALYRLSHSESLSLELGNETPETLGGTRNIRNDELQLGIDRQTQALESWTQREKNRKTP